ncbi:Glutamate-1-semialdehyde 2 1-aminomutase 1 [Bienertia sinuspersici]
MAIRFSISFCVMAIMFAVFALAASAAAPENPSCRNFAQLCSAYGAYTCCEGFSCTGTSQQLSTGNGFCLPIQQLTPSPTDECKKAHNICQIYGQFSCCEGLSCVHPRSLPPVVGVDPEELMLPPGLGVCEPIKL